MALTGSPRARAICILGMHRSGTSVVVRSVNLLGVYLGEDGDLLPPVPDNREGVWERQDIVNFHNRVLAHFSRAWHSVGPLPEEWHKSEGIQPFRNELRELISGRLCIDLLCVYVVRNPLDVAKSLQQREGFPIDKSFGIWLTATLAALNATRDVPTVFVSYDKFLSDWEPELRRCVAGLSIPWPADDSRLREGMASFLRADLRHSASLATDLSSEDVPRPVIELYRLLYGASEGFIPESVPDVRDTVERLRCEFYESSRYFRHDVERLFTVEHLWAQSRFRLADLDVAVRMQEAALNALRQELRRIHSTLGWSLGKKLEWLTNKALPSLSVRREYYDLTLLLIKTLVRQGWRRLIFEPRGVWGAFREKQLDGRLEAREKQFEEWFDVIEPDFSEDPSYNVWISQHEPTKTRLRAMRSEAKSWPYQPKISLITPVYNPGEFELIECIKSVLVQIYDNWELCLVDGGSDKPHVRRIMKAFARMDRRIKSVRLRKNLGIAGNSNEALRRATGEYVGFLDHDDVLAPFALYEVVEALNEKPELDFVYSDEDKVPANSKARYGPYFKPGWSPDLFSSVMYTCHFGVYRRSLIDEIGGFRDGFDGSQDFDLTLRVTEKTDKIFHVPKVLYHWRSGEGSAASSVNEKLYAYESAKKALGEFLHRRRIAGTVLNGHERGNYRVKRAIIGTPLVSIVIPTRNRRDLLERCLTSIGQKTDYKNYEIVVVNNQSDDPNTIAYLDQLRLRPSCRVLDYDQPFNFSAINNMGAKHAKGEILLFLNNDTEVISQEWLGAMLEHAQRKEVGAVGAKLLYPDNRVQHAGVILGLRRGVAEHAYKGLPDSDPGYFQNLHLVRNYSAVTGACLMTRKEVFDEVGGFDAEHLPVAFNDVDFCLRLRKMGYLIVYTPYAVLYHYESATRGRELDPREEEYMKTRWKAVIDDDPYYNPNLTRDAYDFSLRLQ
ncbi:MAG: glycosyltransferase [Nitrospirae bacterium]|nr:glycosyltransferase [Nitrospirota bacterium]